MITGVIRDNAAMRKAGRQRGRAFLKLMFLIPALIIAVQVFLAVFADWIMPYDPYVGDLTNRLIPPFWMDGGSTAHLLGTDTLGRDTLSRTILGARVSLGVAALSIIAGGMFGTLLGMLAGYQGKWLDSLVMRLADGMLAIPGIFLALLLAVVLGPSFWSIVLVIGLTLWALFARMARGVVLSCKAYDYVAQAKIAGASSFQIMLRHILPNILNTMIVMGTLQVGSAVLTEAALSFIGVGVPPPTPSWGNMAAMGRSYIDSAWWLCVFPGLAIFLTVASLNMLGDWVRDALDPKLRQL